MDKIILTDCDGVLLNWVDGFEAFMAAKGFERLSNTEHEYEIHKWYDDVTTKTRQDFVLEFNEGMGVSCLDPWRDAVEYVTRLSEEGFQFIPITALSAAPSAREYREENLREIFGDANILYDEMICINPQECKGDSLEKWRGTGLFWLEDHFTHAATGFEMGLRPIFFLNDYNRHFSTDLFPSVESWEECYRIIVQEYENTVLEAV